MFWIAADREAGLASTDARGSVTMQSLGKLMPSFGAFCAKNDDLFLGQLSGDILRYDVGKGRVAEILKCHNGPVSYLNIGADGTRCDTCSLDDQTARKVDLQGGNVTNTERFRVSPAGTAALVDDGTILFVCDRNAGARAKRFGMSEEWRGIGIVEENWLSILCAPNGQVLTCISNDCQTITVQSLASSEVLWTRRFGVSDCACCAAFSPDSDSLAVASGTGRVTVYKAENGIVQFECHPQNATPLAIALSGDHLRVVTGFLNGDVVLTDLPTGNEVAKLRSKT